MNSSILVFTVVGLATSARAALDRAGAALGRAGAALAMAVLLGACGGTDNDAADGAATTPPPIAESGQVVVTLTDAPGDFVAYLVDVTSVRLTRANGDVVETLPLTTRVDFAELTDVSEFLTVATVPAGFYTTVTLTVDFSNAEIMVTNDAGEVVAARPVDADGAPLGTLDLALSLTNGAAIRVTPATVHAVSLDFDLDASNTVDDSVEPPTVTVEPVLLAMPELEVGRDHRARGLLSEVDEDASTVTLRVRPFRHWRGAFGELAIRVHDETAYEIDGEVYQGAEGLAVLSGLAAGSPVVAQGRIRSGRFQADSLLAGDSVPWSDADVVHGVVRSRDATSLTVSGVNVAFADGRREFQREITVLLGEDTIVSAPGQGATLDQLDISVGQRIVASGEFTDDRSLDVGSGRVRLLLNRLWGDVVTVDPLVVDVSLLNGRRPRAFDFTGTGMTAAEDANPDAYRIDTGTLGLLQLDEGDVVQVRGLVNRFGFAPPDFLARTVVDVATMTRGATALVGWPEGSNTPFLASALDRLDLNLADARSVIKLHGRVRSLPIEPEALALVAPTEGLGSYVVIQRGAGVVTVYREFEAAVRAMTELLDMGARLHRLTAHGRYTDNLDELVTMRASFVFEVGSTSAAD